MSWIAKYRKALVAALAAGSGTLLTALADDKITSGEWVLTGLAILGALGVTWAVPNKPDIPASPTSYRTSL